MANEIGREQLRVADVFLYHGEGFVSKAIRFFDGTEASHASLYLGPAVDQVTEALWNGVRTQPRAASLAGSSYVLAYRHKTAPEPMDRVTKVAARFVEEGTRYGYEQIVLLAMLALTRRVKPTPLFGAFLRKVLDSAAARLADWVDEGTGRKSMICSEVVFRCYDDALESARDAYTIEVDGVNSWPAGLVAAPSAGAPARRRPEPGSVLDTLVRPGLGAFTVGAAPPAALTRPPAVPDEREVEAAGEAYLASVLAPAAPPAQLAPLAQDPALEEAVRRFAVALELATRGPAPAGLTVPGALEQLYRTAAAFVTPGDLYKSRSLMRLGVVEKTVPPGAGIVGPGVGRAAIGGEAQGRPR